MSKYHVIKNVWALTRRRGAESEDLKQREMCKELLPETRQGGSRKKKTDCGVLTDIFRTCIHIKIKVSLKTLKASRWVKSYRL